MDNTVKDKSRRSNKLVIKILEKRRKEKERQREKIKIRKCRNNQILNNIIFFSKTKERH